MKFGVVGIDRRWQTTRKELKGAARAAVGAVEFQRHGQWYFYVTRLGSLKQHPSLHHRQLAKAASTEIRYKIHSNQRLDQQHTIVQLSAVRSKVEGNK